MMKRKEIVYIISKKLFLLYGRDVIPIETADGIFVTFVICIANHCVSWRMFVFMSLFRGRRKLSFATSRLVFVADGGLVVALEFDSPRYWIVHHRSSQRTVLNVFFFLSPVTRTRLNTNGITRRRWGVVLMVYFPPLRQLRPTVTLLTMADTRYSEVWSCHFFDPPAA